jgi:hypothetical protein
MSTGHWQTGGPRSRMQSLGSHAVEEILGFALRQGIASRSLGRAWFILQGTPASSVAPKTNTSAHWARVAVACNPSYSGGRDQEERGSKPAPAKQFGNHLSRKKTLPQKKGWWSGSRGRPQYRKERKKSQACVARSLRCLPFSSFALVSRPRAPPSIVRELGEEDGVAPRPARKSFPTLNRFAWEAA